jgi:hypothetical protein
MTNCKNANAGLTFFPAFQHSGIYRYLQHPRSPGSFALFLSTQQKVTPWGAFLTASLFTTNLAFLHPSELCCTLELQCILLSFMLLHPTELPCTLLSFTASFLELHCTLWAVEPGVNLTENRGVLVGGMIILLVPAVIGGLAISWIVGAHTYIIFLPA